MVTAKHAKEYRKESKEIFRFANFVSLLVGLYVLIAIGIYSSDLLVF